MDERSRPNPHLSHGILAHHGRSSGGANEPRGFRLRCHRRRRRPRRFDGRRLAGASRTSRHPVRTRPVSALPHRRVAAGVGQRRARARSAPTSLVRQAGFPQKWGATFMSADGRIERYADFGAAPRRARASDVAGAARHVRRHCCCGTRQSSGADVREQHRVVDVSFDADGVTATVQGVESRAAATVRARAIIDASGRGALLSRKFDLRIDEPRLANLAVFSHYSGVPRQPGRRAGDIRIVARDDLGWFWLIPISDELMSVGVVLPRAAHAVARRAWSTARCSSGRLPKRRRSPVCSLGARASGRCESRRTFSFGSRAYAGDRWVLAGDAGSFLDPVFSTGVAIALESGLEAATGDGGWPRRGRSVGAAVRVLRAAPAPALPCRSAVSCSASTRRSSGICFSPRTAAPRMFRALVTVFAGYWRPSLATRDLGGALLSAGPSAAVVSVRAAAALRHVEGELHKNPR